MLRSGISTSLKRFQSTLGNSDAFAKLSHQWWDRSGPFKALHSLNAVRVPLIRRAVCSLLQRRSEWSAAKPLLGFNILELGCGGGLLAEPLSKLGANVYAVDADKGSVEVAREHAAANRLTTIRYAVGDAQSAGALFDDAFDAVVASEVLEHAVDWRSVVATSVELVRPGGLLFYTTINRTLWSRLFAILVAENLLRIVPKGIHDWRSFIKPDELRSVLEASKCSVVACHGLLYEPLSNSWRPISNNCVNYALYAVRLI